MDRYKLAVGFLRQWLNEDRIGRDGRMVTSEQLHHWLNEGVEAYARGIIGEDEIPGNGFSGGVHINAEARNKLRQEQRAKLKEEGK